MSITFCVDSPVVGHVATCACGDAETITVYPTYPEYLAAHAAGDFARLACGDPWCATDTLGHKLIRQHQGAPSLNVSNTNARFLFDELGLPFDYCGTITGRTLLASVDGCTATDPGAPTTTTQTAGGGQIVDCGRPPGYLPDRLAVLREVAVFAATHDLDVVWG